MQDDEITFNIFKIMNYPMDNEDCFFIDIMDKLIMETFREGDPTLLLEACIIHSDTNTKEDHARRECINYLEAMAKFSKKEDLMKLTHLPSILVPCIQEPPKFELKELPSHLRYAFLGDNSTLPINISSSMIRTGKKNY